MKLLSFRVMKFRNVVDSGTIKVDKLVTCLVGKNEAGKSALLEALSLLNPAYGETFIVEEQYPRWLLARDRREIDPNNHAPIEATFELDKDDINAVNEVLGDGALDDELISVSRKYDGSTTWNIKYNERVIIGNLMLQFPETARSLVVDAETLEDIRGILGSFTPTDNGELPSNNELESAKQVIQERGLGENTVGQRIIDILEPRLPRFFRFTEYSTLPGRINLNKLATNHDEGPGQSGFQAARALLNLAGADLEQSDNGDYELRTGELEAIQIELTRQVFEYWKQNPDLEVLIDVDKKIVSQSHRGHSVEHSLDIRLRDKRTGYSNDFAQRSSGFQWFFSFFSAFSEFEGQQSPIVLLDEPALNLHGKAQADFLHFINNRLSPFSPVIYTTHSPFMVEPDRLDRVRVVEDKGPLEGAICTDEVIGSDPDSLFPLQASLGYDIAQNLVVGPHNLVVEGTSDFIYLTVISRLCEVSNRESLDDRWRILPAGGATNIPTFVSLIGPHLDVTALVDSDTKGMQRINNMIGRNLLAKHRLVFANEATDIEHADIEDLFSVDDYLNLYNETFGTQIKASDLSEGYRIVKRIEGFTGARFDHGLVSETFLREQQKFSLSDASLDRFAALFGIINKTIDT